MPKKLTDKMPPTTVMSVFHDVTFFDSIEDIYRLAPKTSKVIQRLVEDRDDDDMGFFLDEECLYLKPNPDFIHFFENHSVLIKSQIKRRLKVELDILRIERKRIYDLNQKRKKRRLMRALFGSHLNGKNKFFLSYCRLILWTMAVLKIDYTSLDQLGIGLSSLWVLYIFNIVVVCC